MAILILVRLLIDTLVDYYERNCSKTGMDEVEYNCWKSNPHMAEFMVQHQMRDYHQLEQYYAENTLNNVRSLGYKYMMYQDPVDNGVKARD